VTPIARRSQDENKRLEAVWSLDLLDTPPEDHFDQAARLAATICQTPIGLVSVVDQDRQWFKAKVGLDVCETPRSQAFCAHAIGLTEPLIVPDARLDQRFVHNPLVTGDPDIRFYAGMPITTSDGFTVGTLCVIDTVPRDLTDQQKSGLILLGRHVSAQIALRNHMKTLNRILAEKDVIEKELHAANAKLLELSLTDSLTGLRNRRAFDQRLARELDLAAPVDAPLSLVIVDLDHFKSFNDEFGHGVGDDILCSVARLLQKSARASDLAFRQGGEEFALLLPRTPLKAAVLVAERVRVAISAHSWRFRPVTVSVGVAARSAELASPGGLVHAADAALYRAKESGRNRVGIHPGLPS
jgi:diguanylate cyclase (GGDEF)-like protein